MSAWRGSTPGDLAEKARRRLLDVFHGTAFEAHRSIVEGSPLTGAPGQPVDIGTLKQSYQMSWNTPVIVTIASTQRHAKPVEDGVGSKGQPVTYGKGGNGKSKVGGSHSLKLTVAGFPKIVDHVNASIPK